MYRKFLSVRSPLRLLEQGLHGGLGKGNVGLVLAGPGVGKTSFLVGVALDDLLRGDHVLHVALDQSVSHTRAYYDTVFHELASSTHLEDEARIHAEIDRHRSIRSYPAPGFGPGKLREAVKFEEEAGSRPGLVVVEGFDVSAASEPEMRDMKALAGEIEAELWFSVACSDEEVPGMQPRSRSWAMPSAWSWPWSRRRIRWRCVPSRSTRTPTSRHFGWLSIPGRCCWSEAEAVRGRQGRERSPSAPRDRRLDNESNHS